MMICPAIAKLMNAHSLMGNLRLIRDDVTDAALCARCDAVADHSATMKGGKQDIDRP